MEAPAQSLRQIRGELASYAFNDYVRHLGAAEAAASDGQPLRVAILRSYTVEPIEPVLKLRLLAEGFRPTLWFGAFNQYVQEIVDEQSRLHDFAPDLVLLFVRIEELLPDFVDDFGARPASEWEQRLGDKARELAELATRIEETIGAQVIVQNGTLPDAHFGVYDAQQGEGQGYLAQRFNGVLANALADRKSVFLWDFDGFVRAYGHERLFDPKMWYVSRNPYRQAAYPALGEDLARYILSALGRVKKCIVLDLDNTLWGGVVGEDGMDGIALGHSYPGNCFRDFQKELLKLHQRGILLAINSKNNEADALQIIDTHPDMVLRREHFSAWRINWQDKASNLQAIARELNIGVDSCIMLDDSAVECELLRRECPECDVVMLPEKPYLLPAVPRRLPGVENIRLTMEDRRKGEMYRARTARQEQEARYANLEEFLRSLDIEVEIEPAGSFSIPRIAQLTQKTNQMNATTRRYTEAQIQAFVDDPDHAVFSVASKDRFGSDGIIGVFILHFAGDACRIDSFLLSCRVIGRGIEQHMIAMIVDLCRERGVPSLIGEFLPTAKNQPAAGLYERLGFQRISDSQFGLDLGASSVAYPAHIRSGGRSAAPAR